MIYLNYCVTANLTDQPAVAESGQNKREINSARRSMTKLFHVCCHPRRKETWGKEQDRVWNWGARTRVEIATAAEANPRPDVGILTRSATAVVARIKRSISTTTTTAPELPWKNKSVDSPPLGSPEHALLLCACRYSNRHSR